MSNTISIRVEPTTGRKFAGQRRHDLRDPSHLPNYVDRSRTHANSVIIEPPDPASVRADIEAQRKTAGQQKLRADARTTIRGVITFGTEAQAVIRGLPKERQDALYQRIGASISKETGHQLIGLVAHRDESAPHCHFTLRGYRRDADGKEQPWRHGKDMMQRIQDIAAKEVRHLGIHRGTPKAERIARGDDLAKVIHRSVAELHRDLPAEIEARRQEVEAQEREASARLEQLRHEMQEQEAKAKNNRRLIDEQQAKLEAGKVTEEQAAKRIAAYERREADAKAKAEKLEREAAELEARLQPVAQDVARRNPLPQPPRVQQVEVVTKDGFFKQERQTLDIVPAEAFRRYQQDAEIRQQNLVTAAAQAEARAERQAREAAEAKRQSDLRGKLIEAIARSPLAGKVAEHVTQLQRWIEHVRQIDAKEQAKQQQRQRGGYELER